MKELMLSPWFERTFHPVNNQMFAVLLERLRGTPARIKEKIKAVPLDVLQQKPEGQWSVLEQIGHLEDLEPLWIGRVEDIADSREYLRSADLTNRKTHEAGHNSRSPAEIISGFSNQRGNLVKAFRSLNDEDLEKQPLHPRLKTPMKVVDLMHFIAEHDDHHLAACTLLLERHQQFLT